MNINLYVVGVSIFKLEINPPKIIYSNGEETAQLTLYVNIVKAIMCCCEWNSETEG